ncbi:MAG: hypothetical protein ABJC39_11760, partial [Chloroflexota bacterium]
VGTLSAPSTAPSVAEATTSTAASAVTTPKSAATPVSRPPAIPRPTDLPTDGTCESGHICLGVLAAGKSYHTDVFKPGFAFTPPAAGWENLAETGGDLDLDALDAPGDVIMFFRQPRATTETGDLILSVPVSVDGIQKWLASYPAVTVSSATQVSIGGLAGVRMDFTIAPGAGTAGDCPTQACLSMFKGTDGKSWAWDWGTATAGRQRIYLLKATDTVVAIFVDSLDCTTFDALTQTADALLATVKFDKP